MSRFWKWYISGFASRPDQAIYESPRFYRIVLTLLFFSGLNPFTIILLPFLPKNIVSGSSSSSSIVSSKAESGSSSSLPATSSAKAGPTLCAKRLNQGSSFLASFDWSNQTMNVYVIPGIKIGEDIEKAADAVANEIFLACDIKTVKFESKGYDGYLIRTSP